MAISPELPPDPRPRARTRGVNIETTVHRTVAAARLGRLTLGAAHGGSVNCYGYPADTSAVAVVADPHGHYWAGTGALPANKVTMYGAALAAGAGEAASVLDGRRPSLTKESEAGQRLLRERLATAYGWDARARLPLNVVRDVAAAVVAAPRVRPLAANRAARWRRVGPCPLRDVASRLAWVRALATPPDWAAAAGCRGVAERSEAPGCPALVRDVSGAWYEAPSGWAVAS